MAKKLRVKIISKNPISAFQLFDLPQAHADRIEYILDKDARSYDWLVVYDDLPKKGDERLPLGTEELACPQSQTVLLTYEPSSIKFYGTDYLDQFGMVLTGHEPHLLPHRNRRDMPPVGWWYYGGLAQAEAHAEPPEKTGLLSVFGSPKAHKESLHHRRAAFLNELVDAFADRIDVFGRAYQPVEHKAEGIDRFKYHIAVENHISDHHWTEKLSDAFLGYSLPFYVGCTNAAAYFPEDSFIYLDIKSTEKSVAIIDKAIADNEYEKRLPAIIEARRRVMEDLNLGNMLAKHILQGETVAVPNASGRLLSRHAMLRRDVPTFLRYAWGRTKRRRDNRHYWRDFLSAE